MNTRSRKRAPAPAPGARRQRVPRSHRSWDSVSEPPAPESGEPPVYAFTPRPPDAIPAVVRKKLGLQRPGRPEPGPWDDAFRASDFFARNPIFRFDEFLAAALRAGRAPASATSILRHHLARGHLEHLRRGIYSAPGHVDPWVLGSKLTRDAVIAYDGALSFYGFTDVGYGITVMTRERLRHFVFSEIVYRGALPPPSDDLLDAEHTPSIAEAERSGQRLAVTTRERTLVDTLDRLELGPGPAVLWGCYCAARGLDYLAIADHAVRLSRQVTVARVGFFLEHLLGASHPLVEVLRRHRPRSPIYFDRPNRRGAHVYDAGWNLNVPVKLLNLVRNVRP